MIEIHNLCKFYGKKKAIDNLNLSAKPGEILGFLGPNGAGKTTTVKILTGMIYPDSGTAEVAGFDVLEQPVDVKKRIGYVPESGALFDSLSAWEYLHLISDLHHLDSEVARKRVTEFLTLFNLFDQKDLHLNQFSKGMRQKVLLSAAFIHNPDVLFLDEPLNGLDANAALLIKDLLRKFAAQGKTVMFCSHILEVVERICSRIAIIDQGRIVAEGTPDEIVTQSAQPNLEQAFHSLTVSDNSGQSTGGILEALDRN